VSISAPSRPNAHNYKFTRRCLFETPTVGAPGRGLCAFQIRPQMATHVISWVPGAHVCFGDLDFIVTLGGELALATRPCSLSLPLASATRGLRASLVTPLDPSYPGRPRATSPSLQKTPCGAPRQHFCSVSATLRQPLATFWHYAWFSRPRTASSWGQLNMIQRLSIGSSWRS